MILYEDLNTKEFISYVVDIHKYIYDRRSSNYCRVKREIMIGDGRRPSNNYSNRIVLFDPPRGSNLGFILCFYNNMILNEDLKPKNSYRM